MKTRFQTLVLTAALAASANGLFASGPYISQPPQPSKEQNSLDRGKYSLGQRVFTGKVKPNAQADAPTQRPRLAALQDRLPERLARKMDLTTLAGKLTPEQLDALEYYVNRRFGK